MNKFSSTSTESTCSTLNLPIEMEGTVVLNKIAERIVSGERVVFDFSRGEVVSNSFADECFPKLMLDFDLPFIKAHITFQD